MAKRVADLFVDVLVKQKSSEFTPPPTGLNDGARYGQSYPHAFFLCRHKRVKDSFRIIDSRPLSIIGLACGPNP
jgi:hypothetical protein